MNCFFEMAKRKTHRKKKSRAKKSSRSNFSNALCQLKRLKGNQQRQAMSMANDTFIRQFCSSVKKLKYAKLPPKLESKLRRYRKKLRMLTNSKTSLSKKRKTLSQRGGGPFLSLLAASLPVLGPIVGDAFNKAVQRVKNRFVFRKQ